MKSLQIPSAEIIDQEQVCCEQVIAEAKKRELDVLYAFADGLTPQQVASRLGIKVKTVDMYKTSLFTLCRNAWNLPRNEKLKYPFLHTKFAKVEKVREVSIQSIVQAIPDIPSKKTLLPSPSGILSTQDRFNCDQVIAEAKKRELDVLYAFADSLTPQQVASRLGIKVKTVDTYKTKLLALCRTAWKLPPNEQLDYRFLNEKFAEFFQPCETGSAWFK